MAAAPDESAGSSGYVEAKGARAPESIIYEGQTFPTFEALEEAVREFENATLHKYFKSEARTLESAAKKGIKRAGDNSRGLFKYYSCLWLCVRGGKPVCRSRGERKSRTIRIGCPALIRTRISNCGAEFQVVQVVYDHSHGSSPEMFHQLQMKQTGVKHDDPQKKSKYIKKKSRLKDDAQNKLRDLLSTVVGEGQELSLEESVDKISQLYADDLTVAVDDTNQCVALALCTERMRTLWREFPEVLTIESSSHSESLDLANIIHFLVTDAMGELRPVMFAILLKSESNLYEWLLNEFVRQNPSAVRSTLLCLVGRPYTEFDFVTEVFPEAQILWEPSQSINSFRVEVATKAVHLSEAGRRAAAEHFQKLVFCRSADMKRVLREEFAAALAVPETVQACYDHDWEPHYSLWNMGRHPYDEAQHEFVLKRMQKLKRYTRSIVQNAAANLFAVFTKIADLYSLLEDVYNGDILYHLVKVNQSRYQSKTPVDEAEFKYKALVTEFAYLYLKGQFNTFERGLKLSEHNRMVTFTRIDDREVKVFTSRDSCSCIAFRALHLPCGHLLSFRIGSQLDLYNEALVDERWKRGNIRVEGDADQLVRLPLAAMDDSSSMISSHQTFSDSTRLTEVEDSEVKVHYVQELSDTVPEAGQCLDAVEVSESSQAAEPSVEERVTHVTETVPVETAGLCQDHPEGGPENHHSPSDQPEQAGEPTPARGQSAPSTTNAGKRPCTDPTSLAQKRLRLREAAARPPRQYRERRERIEEVCNELCAVGSGVGGSLFSLRINVLRDILEAWQDGEEVAVQRVTHDNHQEVRSQTCATTSVREGGGQLLAVVDPASGAPFAMEHQGSAQALLRYSPVVQVKGATHQQVYVLNSDDNSVQLMDSYPGQVYTIETTTEDQVTDEEVVMQ